MHAQGPSSWLLDGHLGWRTKEKQRVADGATGLRLTAAADESGRPTGPLSLTWIDDSMGGLTMPQGMALSADAVCYLLVPAKCCIKRYDHRTGRFHALPGVGGEGSDARQFRNPRAVAIAGEHLYVADRGNQRVQVFALRPTLPLRYVLGPWDASTGPTDADSGQAWDPLDLATHRDGVYILDHRHGRVYWHAPRAEAPVLVLADAHAAGRWSRVAVDREGRIYLLSSHGEGGRPAAVATPSLEVYDSVGNPIEKIADAGEVRDRFDPPAVRLFYTSPNDDRNSGRFCIPQDHACSPGHNPAPASLEQPLSLCASPVSVQTADAARFAAADLKDASGLTAALRHPCTPVARYIREHLSGDERALIDGADSRLPPDTLRQTVLRALNRLLTDTGFADERLFIGVRLPAQNRNLLGQGTGGRELARLNRSLLEASFPGLIAHAHDGAGGRAFDRVGRCASFDPAAPAGPPLYAADGYWISGPLDSRLYRCQWHRVEMDLPALPPGTSVTVSTYATDEPAGYPPAASDGWDRAYAVAGAMQPPPGTPGGVAKSDPDPVHEFLVQSRQGQYLWVKVALQSHGYGTPVVGRLRAYFPRDTYLRHLPAIFSADDDSRWFLERFLSIFQTEWDDLEQKVEEVGRYFDAAAVPQGPFLDALAQWVALPLEGAWSADQRRRLLLAVRDFYRRRGTFAGLRSFLRVYLENMSVPAVVEQSDYPVIVEGFRERQQLMLSHEDRDALGVRSLLWGPSAVARLQLGVFARTGEVRLVSTGDPARDIFHEYAHRFRVFVPAAWVHTGDDERMLRRAVDTEKPAQAAYDLCLVEPRFRVGVQSTIGVDTILGDYPVARLSSAEEMSHAPPSRPPRHCLGYDLVLSHGSDDWWRSMPSHAPGVGAFVL